MMMPSVERKVRTELARMVSSPMRIEGRNRGIKTRYGPSGRVSQGLGPWALGPGGRNLREDDAGEGQRGAGSLPGAEEFAEEHGAERGRHDGLDQHCHRRGCRWQAHQDR